MKIKPNVLRTGVRNWDEEAERLRADGHMRGDVFAKTVGADPAHLDDPFSTDLVPPTTSLTTGVAYTQNFDTLSNTAGSTTNDLLINGWAMNETGLGARDNDQYAVDTGGSNTGDTFSYGAAAATDRALGSLQSGTLIPTFGAAFTNTSGATITSLLIDYDGEQWRISNTAAARDDRLDFQISFDATSLTTGTWTDVNELDFTNVIKTAASAGALNGNLDANNIDITHTITGLTIANGATFWIRWVDLNAAGADDGLAIDNFSITANAVVAQPGTLAINDVTLAEGDSGTTTFTFTVTRSGGDDGAVGATWTVNLPGGAGGADASDVGGTLTGTVSFADGETSRTISVDVVGDTAFEPDETFTVVLSAATGGATLGDASGLGTITNDDPAPPVPGELSIGDASLAEGDSGTTAFTFTVLRSGGSDGAVSATWTLDAPGGASLADLVDFESGQATTGSVDFADGETSQTITVLVQGDVDFEDDETFLVVLSTPTGGATLGNVNGTGEILNDDPAPAGTFSIDDTSEFEGDSGTTTFTFTVTRSGGSAGAVAVDYVVNAPGGAGNADSGDFIPAAVLSGTLNFVDGEVTQTITVEVQGDTDFEADEGFTVTLSNATGGAAIGDGSGAGIITNDDIAPPAGSVSVADVSVVEGNSGTVTLTFTLTRTGGTGAFDVSYATSNGGNPSNASATAGSDYAATSGTISFGVGQNTATVSVTVNGDTLAELSEELTLTLSGATNGATISDAVAIGTITTDDTLSAAPANPWLNEFHYDNGGTDTGEFIEVAGAAGTSLAGWTIALYNGNPGQLNVYTTLNLSGTIPDQSNGFGTLQFAAVGIQNGGAGSNGEPDGIALINASGQVVEFISYEGVMTPTSGPAAGMTSVNVGAGVFEDGATNGTSIIRVDGPPGGTWQVTNAPSAGAVNPQQTLPNGGTAAPGIAVSDVSVNEAAGTVTFTVTRTNVAAGAFTVDYETANGTALAGSDYDATSGTLSFADNQVQAQVTVNINNDATPELNETFFLNLSNATGGATIQDAQGQATIVNDDGTPIQVSINDVSIAEGASGTSILTFTVTRSGGTGAFSVDFGTVDGSATQPSDYLATSGTLNFGAGVNTQTVSVTINGDLTPESTENFFVNLSNATNDAVIADAQGIGTIVNDEATFIHDIQGTSYFSPLLAQEGIASFNVVSATAYTVRAVVTAVDNVGARQGYYLSEEVTDWDGNTFTSEGIFVMTRNDANVGTVVSGVSVGDLVEVTANVMEYQSFQSMPRTVLVNPTGLSIIGQSQPLPSMTLTNMPNAVLTVANPNYFDSVDDPNDTFDASVYALSYFETVEGMLVTIPNMVVADGFVSTSSGDPYLMAYSLDSANPEQINDRGGYTIAGDPPVGPPDTATPGDDTTGGGRVLHDGDVNPDIIELDFTDFAMAPPTGLTTGATMGDLLGDVTGIIDFDFTDRKLFVTAMEPGGFVDTGQPAQEVTVLGDDSRSLTVATFNVENLDPTDGAARFTALANAIANNLNAPDIISIEEMQDNNGAAGGGVDASTSWQMLVDALNAVTGAHYQWVDELPLSNAEGGEQQGNIRVGFLYNTDRVQLGDLDANATIAERRQYTDRIGDGVRDAGDLIAFSDNMLGGEINTADWANTRRSLLGEFNFNGNTVYVTANHWPSKGGSGQFWQLEQTTSEPDNADWAQRNAVAQDVYAMLNHIQQNDTDAGIVAGGDFNDFYFYRPLTTVTGYTMADGSARVGGARFDNLTLTLDEAERYTYTFDGRSQAIDHIIANQLLSDVATYDIVHLNTGYNQNGTGPNADPSLSDHDPAVASFDFRDLAEELVGGGGNNLIDGYGGDDIIFGGAGNDTLIGGAGIDTLSGGTDNDFYFVDNSNDSVLELAGEGNDRVFASASYGLAAGTSVETLSTADNAGTAAINLAGNELANILFGNAGTNTLSGGAGNDLLDGKDGNDTLQGGADNDILYGRDGNDRLFGGAGSNYLAGGVGDDQYYVDSSSDAVVELTGEGNDRVLASVSYVLAANMSVETLSTSFNAGTGAINLIGNGLANSILGNDGANVLNGGAGNDTLDGKGGNDTLDGGADNDTLYGGAGNDALYGGTGTNYLAGNAGDDIYVIHNGTDTVAELAGEGADRVYAAISYTLGAGQSVETLSTDWNAGTAAINLTGNALANHLIGNDGANVLNGGAGNDVLDGKSGADTYAFTTALGAGNVDVVFGFQTGIDKIALDDAIFTAVGGLGTLSASAFHTGSAAADGSDRIVYNSSTGQLFYDADGAGGAAAVQFATLATGLNLSASDFMVI
ncbi:MAG TPA: Calx-beta domain-containing protein [Allosphingosinicella sp.]|nr:Calx-beta domain-containing protein [Allosphingosinicella sp.]